MRKLHRIMRKFKQFIELRINPVQCIYMLMVNQDSKLPPIQLHLRLIFFPLRYRQFASSFHCLNKRVSNRHFAESFAKINKAIKKYFVSRHEFCFNLEISSKIVLWLNHRSNPSIIHHFQRFFYTYVLRALILFCTTSSQITIAMIFSTFTNDQFNLLL